ncbi:hypothetical protein AB0C18_17825 [Nonomuraea muscovyensis]|uniref:hypothetical protein n=1 Tax=Nonomuraea muscovyensis TaxID=1124761 RepID=UPI0033E5FBBE
MGHDPTAYAPKPRVTVPTAVLLAKDDVTIRRSAERDADSAGPDRGGAYLALEVPDLLVADVRAFFGAKRVCQARCLDSGRSSRPPEIFSWRMTPWPWASNTPVSIA